MLVSFLLLYVFEPLVLQQMAAHDNVCNQPRVDDFPV